LAGIAGLCLFADAALAGTTSGVPGTIDTTDSSGAGYQGEFSMTVGTSYTLSPGVAQARSVHAICTVAGNVSVTYADGSTGVWAVAVGNQTIPAAAVAINSSGTTATCTYAGLK
jgi:hypothetical protein